MKKGVPVERVPGVTPPVQERSRGTFERILDAAERLLRDRDFDALRIEDVLAEADVSTGSFYARFDGKEAMLSALLDRYRASLEAILAGGREVDAPPTLEARARLEVRHRIRRFRANVGRMRTVVLRARADHDTAAELVRLTRRVNDQILELFRPCLGEVGHPDPEAAILRGAYFVGAVCRDRILFGSSPHATSVPLPLSRLEDELTRMLVGYLRG